MGQWVQPLIIIRDWKWFADKTNWASSRVPRFQESYRSLCTIWSWRFWFLGLNAVLLTSTNGHSQLGQVKRQNWFTVHRPLGWAWTGLRPGVWADLSWGCRKLKFSQCHSTLSLSQSCNAMDPNLLERKLDSEAQCNGSYFVRVKIGLMRPIWWPALCIGLNSWLGTKYLTIRLDNFTQN